MVRVQVRLTLEQVQALRQLSADSGRPIADLVREGVDLYLSSRKRPDRNELWERALSVVGRFSSGLTDVSREHDRYLAEAFDDRFRGTRVRDHRTKKKPSAEGLV